MSDYTPDALASALPDTLGNEVEPGAFWDNATTAGYQAERLAEAGYVLLNPETLAADEVTIERLARASHAIECGCPDDPPAAYYIDAERALRVLAALAGTAAQDAEVGES